MRRGELTKRMRVMDLGVRGVRLAKVGRGGLTEKARAGSSEVGTAGIDEG